MVCDGSLNSQVDVGRRVRRLGEMRACDFDRGRRQVKADRFDAVLCDERGVTALMEDIQPVSGEVASGGLTRPQPATKALPSLSESSETPTSPHRSSSSSRNAG